MARRALHDRFFRMLLRVFPLDFRLQHGSEMEQFFRAEYLNRRRQGGRMKIFKLWIETLFDFFKTAPTEHLDLLRQDLVFTLRSLRRTPGFTLVAVVTLALGIGANSGAFGFVNSLLLQPLPLSDPERLVRLHATSPSGGDFDVFSYPNFADIRSALEARVDLAAHRDVEASMRHGAAAVPARVELVTGNYFDVLGLVPTVGRLLTPQDDQVEGQHRVAVISHGLWKQAYGASPAAVGRPLRLNREEFTIIGVAPAGFRGTYGVFDTNVWVPMMMYRQVRHLGIPISRRGWGWLSATGRLGADIDLVEAQTLVDAVAARLREDHPRVNGDVGFRLFSASSLPESFQEGVSGFLGVFMLISGLLLLVACANIAGVLLARVVGRRRETAIRNSLGATHTHLVRQWLTESTALALLGGLVGLGFAEITQRTTLAILGADELGLPTGFSADPELDRYVLFFTLLLSLFTGLFFGFLPAARAGRAEPAIALKQDAGTASGGRGRIRLQSTFAVIQVVVSVVILVSAGLLLRTLREARAFDPGFDTRNLLVSSLDLSTLGYGKEEGYRFQSELKATIEALPGVDRVSLATNIPLGGGTDRLSYRIPGFEPSADRSTISLHTYAVGPDYFETMAIPILRGRPFSSADRAGAALVAVVNEAMSRRFWPDRSAVGERIQMHSDGPRIEIIGVARDIHYHSLGEDPAPHVYLALAQNYNPAVTIHVRALAQPESLVSPIAETISRLEPDMAVAPVRSFTRVLEIPLFPQRILAALTGIFGSLALALTTLGLYGTLSYLVTQRTPEIGIRMVAGAKRGEILWMVLRRGLSLAVPGLALGLLGALAVTRFLDSLLFGVSATDPLTFALVGLLLVSVTLAACWVPARRATLVDPIKALRYE